MSGTCHQADMVLQFELHALAGLFESVLLFQHLLVIALYYPEDVRPTGVKQFYSVSVYHESIVFISNLEQIYEGANCASAEFF